MGTWEGTEANATIGHGLSTKPNFLLLASLDLGDGTSDGSPLLGFTSLGWTHSIGFSGLHPGIYTDSTRHQNLAPTDSVFYVGSHVDTNHQGTMFFFAAYDIPGFSTWGFKYDGTARMDGPLALYGFSAEFIWLMRTVGATPWTAIDVIRDPYNLTQSGVRINTDIVGRAPPFTEGTPALHDMDILSNGLKIRFDGGDVNDQSYTSGHHFYIMACAKNPFGGNGGSFASGVSPATAR